MIASLCLLALAAFPPDLEPLAEERGLKDVEQIALEFARLEVPEAGNIGWTKTTVQRAQLDAATHYLVHQKAELLDFDALGFVTVESRGLYNADLQLVHEVRLAQPFGASTEPLELEWGEEGFRWRQGRGGWSDASAEVRPTVKTDVALFIQGLDLQVPFEAHVFEEKTKTLETRTLKAGKETQVDEATMLDFEVDGSTPMHHRMTTQGVYMRSKIGDLSVVGMDVSDDIEVVLGMLIADNEAFASVLGKAVASQWSEKRGTFENASLGMSLDLPKGWERASDQEGDGVVLHALSSDANAFMSVSITVLGSGYTLDGWKDGLLESYAESAIDGKVTTKEMSFAKQDAIRFEFATTGDASLDTTAYAWKRNGMGFTVIAGTWVDSPKKLHRETQSIFKSVKF
ncbi:hypothetical protein [Planctomycetes bacterium Poly30]